MRLRVRVVITDGLNFGRVLSVEHTGSDIYVCSPTAPGNPDLRQSLHESGASHVYAPDGRTLHDPGPRLDARTGYQRVWSTTPGLELLEWTERDKPDGKSRRTLRVPLNSTGFPEQRFAVDVWLVEPGRADLVEQVLTHEVTPSLVVGHLLAGTTVPQVLVLVRKLSPQVTAQVAAMLDDAMNGGPEARPARVPIVHW